jgi:hypothetical protein
MLIDTGNPLLDLPAGVFAKVTDAIASSPAFRTLFGGADWLSGASCTSVGMTQADLDAVLPSLTLTLGSSSPIAVQTSATRSYLQLQAGTGGQTWCPAIIGSGGGIGAAFLRSSVVIFDIQNQRLGFAPHTCP